MKKVLFVLSLLICSINVFSQQNDEVTLVVSADGSTKEEATKNAPPNSFYHENPTHQRVNERIESAVNRRAAGCYVRNF